MSRIEPTETGIPITEWEERLARLYERADTHRRPEEFWNAVMANLALIGEAIRRTNYRELLKAAVHAFVWMCGYVTHCNHTTYMEFLFKGGLSEIVGLKYPNVCGHCGRRPCQCDSVQINEVADKSVRYRDLLSLGTLVKWADYGTSDWLEWFWRIYSSRIHLQSPEAIGFHLLEEAGEEARAVRQLVEFRGVLSANIEGISQDFLASLSEAPKLIEEYERCAGEMKEFYHKDSEEDAFAVIRNGESDPTVIRARLVRAKMRFITEIADTFSWFCGVLLKVRKTVRDQGILDEFGRFDLLEVALQEEYGYTVSTPDLTCYQCGETTCKCRFFP